MSISSISFDDSFPSYSAVRDSSEFHSCQMNAVAPIFSAIEENDIEKFCELINKVDLDGYFNYEGADVLLSGFLLNCLINPDIENGEQFISEILAQNPNLNLPLSNDDPLSYYDILKIIRQEFEKSSASEELFTNICLSRIDIIESFQK